MTFAITKNEVVLILLFIAFINIKRISAKSKFSLEKDNNNNEIFNLDLAEHNHKRELIYNNNNKNSNQKSNKENQIKNFILLKTNLFNNNYNNNQKKAEGNFTKEKENFPEKKNEENCTLKTCKIPYGICLDRTTCECGRLYKNLKFVNFVEIKSCEFNFFFLNFLHNNNFSLILINYFKKFYVIDFCSYPKKSQIIAFLLESITLIGIGHFYLLRFFQGFLKMGIFFSFIFNIFLLEKIRGVNKKLFFDERKIRKNNFYFYIEKILNFFYLSNYICLMLFHVFDVFMLANNSYYDGFGFKLISWN